MSANFDYPVATLDEKLSIASRKVPGARSTGVFAEREGLNTGVLADVWCGAPFVIPDMESPQRLSIVSDDGQDDVGGTGAQALLIRGLDANFNEIVEVIPMNGTTPVITTSLFLRTNLVLMQNAGSATANTGSISITSEVTGDLQDIIPPLTGAGCSSRYTVPLGKQIIIQAIRINTEKVDEVDVDLRVRTPSMGEAYTTLSKYLVNSGPMLINTLNLSLPEKTDIKFRATAGTMNARVVLTYTFLQVSV